MNSQEMPNLWAFAVISKEGSVFSLGHPFCGGKGAHAVNGSRVKEVIPNGGTSAAIYRDGKVRSWRSEGFGGGFKYNSSSPSTRVKKFFQGNCFCRLKGRSDCNYLGQRYVWWPA